MLSLRNDNDYYDDDGYGDDVDEEVRPFKTVSVYIVAVKNSVQ